MPSSQYTVAASTQLERQGAISASIRLTDSGHIVDFGADAQRAVASFADKILQQTRGHELGDTGSLLSDLLAKAKGLEVDGLRSANPILRLFGGLRLQINRIQGQYTTVANQIDAISSQLQVRLDRMRDDLRMLDGLHAQARSSIAELDAFIAAGQDFGEQFRIKELPALADAAALSSNDPRYDQLSGQAYQDATQALDRLEKRIYTLQQARQIAIQQLPQIRLVQNGDAALIESLGASINLTVPAWKQKMVLILGLQRQREALAMQKAVTETTNEMIQRTSELLKIQALTIEEESQRGTIDLAVLGKANQDLIDTISGVIQLQVKGRQERVLAAAEMERQTKALGAAMLPPTSQAAAA